VARVQFPRRGKGRPESKVKDIGKERGEAMVGGTIFAGNRIPRKTSTKRGIELILLVGHCLDRKKESWRKKGWLDPS